MLQSIRVIIAGGGTGGHVFPAIAIAKALKDKPCNTRILFVGARGRMEMTKVPAAGFHIIGLPVAGLQRRLTWKNLLVPFKLITSMIIARSIIKRFQPDVVIGVGGYASGPIVRAAAKKGVPTLIQEQNSYPGLTNRILAKKAKKICVAYEGMEKYFEKSKILLTGNPVRQDIITIEGKRDTAMTFFGLSPDKPVLFVTGGSLGAKTINEAVAKNLELLLNHHVQLIWQTGTAYYTKALELQSGLDRPGIYVNAFIDKMDLAYAAADLVVSRAGAIAVSEICAVKKPAILIPSPNVAEDHQTKNALALVHNHAAIMIKDEDAASQLGTEVLELINDEDRKQRLKEKIASLSFHDAADAIADIALGMVNGEL
jgi:UDP-N-acetylglucosamine--N-acetylmuramyl-(pentapeptide) pyrophosphoryl-undecaprenol N-acetylglucosamine transferase